MKSKIWTPWARFDLLSDIPSDQRFGHGITSQGRASDILKPYQKGEKAAVTALRQNFQIRRCLRATATDDDKRPWLDGGSALLGATVSVPIWQDETYSVIDTRLPGDIIAIMPLELSDTNSRDGELTMLYLVRPHNEDYYDLEVEPYEIACAACNHGSKYEHFECKYVTISKPSLSEYVKQNADSEGRCLCAGAE